MGKVIRDDYYYGPSMGTVVSKTLREEDAEQSDARIGAQLAFMGDQIQKTSALLTELELRIEQVLIPENVEPKDGNVPSPPRKPASELSNTIDDLNEQIGKVQTKIQRLYRRVQL